MPSLVAIDIETTGLDPVNDAIIEIGAVRFNGHRIEAEWETLINPNRPIPQFITQLTGITSEMVMHAPPMRAIVQDLAAFVGNSPVVGHNVRFDLSFLQRYKILLDNEVVDTYELASALVPTASRYNLSGLTQGLGIFLPGEAHRAKYDATLTAKLYEHLYEKAMGLPVELSAELVRLSEPVDWDGIYLFQQVLRARSRQPVGAKKAHDSGAGALFGDQAVRMVYPALSPVENPTTIDLDEVAAILEHGGPFSRYFENYEQRPEQVQMMRAVAEAFNEGSHLLVEAGTGTGKSFAYLVPAAMWALQNNQRVVISTNTINLQDQLIKKDIPDLAAALQMDLRATVLKGRNNYLCPRRLENFRRRGPETGDEMRVLAKVLVWLMEAGSGDRTEINLNMPAEREIWKRISAEDEGCKAEVCLSRTGGTCPFYMARMASQSAHLVIVNHALLLADVATGSRVIPEYEYLVVDEAHHLESATTNALSYRATQSDLARLLKELGGTSSGVLGYLLTLLHENLRPSDFVAFEQAVKRISDLAFRLDHDLREFFSTLDLFLDEQREGNPVSAYGQQERILPATRTQPNWEGVEIAWDTTSETLKLLNNLTATLYKGVSEIQNAPEEVEDVQSNLGNIYRRLAEAETNLMEFVSAPDPQRIYWVEIMPNRGQLALQIAPLHIGPLMEKYLWNEKSSVVLTSATLTTNGEFTYLRSRLNAEMAGELPLGSPFDYESSALLYMVNDIPEPADANNYQKSVDRTLVRLAKTTGGRMLALFTSYAQLKRTSQTISPQLAEAGITVYEQGEGASANSLLESFKESEKAVLLGTRAFWEGVDVPGAALSVLVIVKLPFDVPSDPIVAARSETFDDPFNEYSLPEAILRFRQGFGRLIRTQSDRGIVVILDKRVLTKRYGKMFIESLPHCTLKVDSMDKLPGAAAKWLNM